jgi:alpha-L-rhamnosidase
VLIQPALGILDDAEGKMPHPQGEIKVSLKRKGKTGISAEVSLPQNLKGRFVWNGKTEMLKGGKQTISMD